MRANQWMLCAAVLLTAACSEQRSPTAIADESEVRTMGLDPEARREPMERLARRVALALADPGFRDYVRASIDHSPYVERKLPFSRFTASEGGRAASAMAAADGTGPDAVAADLAAAGDLEFYLPVPAHRAAWRGDADILVATEVKDHEAPVAFNTRGERIVLDPRTPPRTPVLAVVPQETDFNTPEATTQICDTCSTGTGGNPPPPPFGSNGPAGLHMTYFSVNKDFEGWLKGNPEYEIHIMGPVSATDTTHYRTLYCIGEHGTTYWDDNNSSWTGDVLLMDAYSLEAFHTAFPNNHFSILAIEDDDTPCVIKVDKDRFKAMIDAGAAAYSHYEAASDSLGFNGKTLVAAKAGYDFLAAVADFFKTNDDEIGVAYANTVTGLYSPNANWAWIGEGAGTYGFVKLEMR